MKTFLQNPWVIGTGTAVIAGIILYFFKFESPKTNVLINNKNMNNQKNNQNNSSNQNQKLTVNLNAILPNKNNEPSQSVRSEISPSQVNLLKQETKVLFIDDLDLKKKIKNLNDAGWLQVSQIKDAPNIDTQIIRDADIIFVDYKGVGELGSDEQGLSILEALTRRYGDNKYLILYSAHTVPIDAFKKGADNYLSKNSTIYELEQAILEGVTKIKR